MALKIKVDNSVRKKVRKKVRHLEWSGVYYANQNKPKKHLF